MSDRPLDALVVNVDRLYRDHGDSSLEAMAQLARRGASGGSVPYDVPTTAIDWRDELVLVHQAAIHGVVSDPRLGDAGRLTDLGRMRLVLSGAKATLDVAIAAGDLESEMILASGLAIVSQAVDAALMTAQTMDSLRKR